MPDSHNQDESPEIHRDPYEVEAVLLRLFGLPVSVLRNALLQARFQWSTCTENDAPSFPGTIFWGYVLRFFREGALTHGWTKDDPRNFSLALSPDGKTAIAVETGDENTGNLADFPQPKTKSKKGPATSDAVEINRIQLEMFPIAAARPKPTLWVFLVRVDRDGGVFGELSLPMNMGIDGKIERWQKRIVISMDTDSGEPDLYRRVPEPGPDIEIRVARR